MANGMPKDGILHTIDINDEISHIPAKFFGRESYKNNIIQHIGSALDIVPEIKEVFDLIFMDGDKREYTEYYDMLFACGAVKSGSIILADNVLWDGKVIDDSPKNLKDPYTQGIIKFNEYVKNDPRTEVVIMPFRDGMSIIRVL